MRRAHLILAGLLLLQVVLILVFRSPFSGASSGVESRPLIPELESSTAVRMEILGADDSRIELVKAGESWTLADLGGFPADGEKVDALLDKLEQLKVRRPVVASGRYHDTFKVADDDNEGRLLLWTGEGDDPDLDLLLGTSPNYRTMHVRRAEEDRVFEIRGMARYDLGANSSAWIVKDLVDVAPESIVGIGVTNALGSFRLEKQEGTWTVVSPEGSQELALDASAVEELVREAVSLRFSEGSGPVDEAAQGFAEPAATVELTWSSGEETGQAVIRIGGKVEDQDTRRYATRSGFGFAGTVWQSSVGRLMEEGLDDLDTVEETEES